MAPFYLGRVATALTQGFAAVAAGLGCKLPYEDKKNVNDDYHLTDYQQTPKTSGAPSSRLNLRFKPTIITTNTSAACKVATEQADDGPEAPATRQQSMEQLPVRPLRRSSEDCSHVSSRSDAEAATYIENPLHGGADLLELYENKWFGPSTVSTLPAAATACSIPSIITSSSSKARLVRAQSPRQQAANIHAYVATCLGHGPIFAPRSAVCASQHSTVCPCRARICAQASMVYAQIASLHQSPFTYAFDKPHQWPQTPDEEACDAPGVLSALTETTTVTFGKPNKGIKYHFIHRDEYQLLSLPYLSLP